MMNIIRIAFAISIFAAFHSHAALYTNWNSGEPNNSGSCTAMYSNGVWDDDDCNVIFSSRDERNYACYGGQGWLITGVAGTMNNAGNAETECKKLGSEYYFAAPFNAYQNEQLAKVLRNQNVGSVWINIESPNGSQTANGSWGGDVSIPPYITRWRGDDPNAFDEPDNGGAQGNQDCVAMQKDGYWIDTECDAGSYRYLCAHPGVNWYLSAGTGLNTNLYDGEAACRATNPDYSFKAPSNDPEYAGTLASVQSSIANGELVWVNVNDRLSDGDFKANENRFMWNDNEPNGNVSGSETCVLKNSNNAVNGTRSEYGWNDIGCSSGARAYACYRHGDGFWRTAGSDATFSVAEGVEACRSLDSGSHSYTFWAPIGPAQSYSSNGDRNAPLDAWFNGEFVAGQWLMNRSVTFWGATTVWDKNEDKQNVNFRTIAEPNDGVLPSHADRDPNIGLADNEDCAIQYSGGYWYDVSCNFAYSFACKDSNPASAQPWRLAPAGQNADLFAGEEACKRIDSSHAYHFSAPSTREEQIELSNLAGQLNVWINATDRTLEKKWLYNQFLTFWAGEGANPATEPAQPVADDALDCAIADGGQGAEWFAAACTGTTRQYLCYNESNGAWTLSASSGDMSEGIYSGQKACNAIGLKFLAPDTFDRQTAASQPGVIGSSQVWINASDAETEGRWNVNQQRFWASGEPSGANANLDCAVMRQNNNVADNGLWFAENCNGGQNYQYLCYDKTNANWRLSTDSGLMYNFADGQNACEAMNTLTEEFYFVAPSYQWENDAAAALLSVGQNVWINGQDRIEEGTWVFNQYLYWSGAALDAGTSAGRDCLTVDNTGHWLDTACDDGPYRVACFSGDGWYLTPASEAVFLSDFSSAQRACDGIGSGYRFFAPVTVEHNRELRDLIASGERVWVNAIDIAEEGKWVFNSDGLPTPNWHSTQPNGQTAENCAYVDADGLWYDAPCTDSRPLVCRANDGSLSLSAAAVLADANGIDFDAVRANCGAGKFFAPETFNQNEAVRELLIAQGVSEAWVNTSDDLFEARWSLNIAPLAQLASITPATNSADGCGYIDAFGSVRAQSCAASSRSVVCSDGNNWRISNSKVVLGATGPDALLLSQAFTACQSEFGGDYTFAAPAETDADAKWQIAQAIALNGEDSAWLNMSDWFVLDQFSTNIPYSNIAYSNPLQATTGCAYINAAQDGWQIEQQCDQRAAHFACFNGSVWEIAPADGTIQQPKQPQLSVDTWDQSYGDLRCKEFFGEGFRFSAPITPREDQKLKQKLAAFDNANTDTWINYYANRLWTLQGQQWFADRINLTIVDNVVIDQGRATQDCGLITKKVAGIEITDEVCTDTHRGLCFNGTDWQLTNNPVQWNQVSAACGSDFGQNYMFAIPRDSLERSMVEAVLAMNSSVWVNYSDASNESDWRANIPVRQWWADGEPSNAGNRDCVVLEPATGEWRSDYCDQVYHHYACKNGSQWAVVGTDGVVGASAPAGVWPQGFTACRKLSALTGQSWSFEYPQDYFENLNVKTTADGLFDNEALDANDEGVTVWVNLTDRYRERDWQRGRQFSDWAANFDFDDNKDCAFIDPTISEVEGQAAKGSWVPDLCYAADNSRVFACTDGQNWKLTEGTSSNNWNEGFAACAALAPAGTWEFAAPETSFDNARLKAALGGQSAWINMQDVGQDGDWAANLSQPDLPPVIKFAAATGNVASPGINTSPVYEQTAGLTLRAEIIDPEGQPIQSLVVSDDSSLGVVVTLNTAMPCTSPCTVDISYTAPALTNIPRDVSFRYLAEDQAGKTTFTHQDIRVLPPILAWYDFNDGNNPNRDITGNGYDAVDEPELPYDFPAVELGALSFEQGTETMTVKNLPLPASYSVAMRVRLDEGDALAPQNFEIRYAPAGPCLDMPGVGAGALSNNANATVYACDGGIDQRWYYEASTGFIRSAANPDYCLAHPDGNPVQDRNVAAFQCSSVNQAWDINGQLISPRANPAFALHATGTANDSNIVLRSIDGSAAQEWQTLTAGGRGLVQKGSADAVRQPMLELDSYNDRLTYSVTTSSGNVEAQTSALRDSQWVNLVLNVDNVSSQMTLFIDGVAQPAQVLAGSVTTNNDDLVFGAIQSAVRAFKGRMDDIQVFARPLSASEVVQILPEPPVGQAEFIAAEISMQEPQVSGAALANPVIVRRTEGSNGYFRAYVSSIDGTATAGNDYAAVNSQLLTWAPGEPALRPSPEYGLIPLLSAAPGEVINSVELNRNQSMFMAFDVNVPVSPRGVIWEQGDSNVGALLAFNNAGDLIARAGTGTGTSGNNLARLVIPAATVNAQLVGKQGTLLMELSQPGTINLWFMVDGLIGSGEVIDLGSATAANGFPGGVWSNGAAGAIGDTSKIRARYVRDQLNGSNENASGHWVEVEVYNLAGSNIAGGASVQGYDGNDAAISPVNGTSFAQVVDGVTTSNPYVDMGTGLRKMRLDLGSEQDISRINIRHYYQDSRRYNTTKLEISNDGSQWTPLFDSSIDGVYVETAAGRNFDRSVSLADESIGTQVFAGVSMARFYNQSAPAPLQQTIVDGKILSLTLNNEAGFDREPTERFSLKVTSAERSADGVSWQVHDQGNQGFLSETEVRLLDYTKNPAGVFQFNVDSMVCSEPHAGDNDGSMNLAAASGARLYRSCEIQVQRRTGVVGEVQVSYGISASGIAFTDDPAISGDDTTDLVLDQKLTAGSGTLVFGNGVSLQSIGFRVLADDQFENNERFRLSLFGPLNNTTPDQKPWMGDPIIAQVIIEDYAIGEVEMRTSATNLEEPLYTGPGVSEIRTVAVSRNNGFNGEARARVTVADDSATSDDYELVDSEGNVIPFADLVWLDGQNDDQAIYIRVKADRFEEYVANTQNSDAAAACYDVIDNNNGAAATDGLSDDLDRNCYVGESFVVTVAQNGGTVPVGSQNTTRVYINDNTEPALVSYTAATQNMTSVSEQADSFPVDSNNNGVWDGESAEPVGDKRIQVSVQRSNSYAEHGLWLFVKGVDKSPAIAASFQGINTVASSPDTWNRSVNDAWMASKWIRDGSSADEWRYLWRLPMLAESNVAGDATITTNITAWYIGDTASNIARIADGNTNTGDPDDYQVHPTNANGRYIDFAWAADHQGGNAVFYNRNGCCRERIDGSRMEFFNDGAEVYQFDFDAGLPDVADINIDIPEDVVFDQMRLTFSGDSQNFREIAVNSRSLTAATTLQTHSVDVVILDNDRLDSANRNIEFSIEPAGDRDQKVIFLGDDFNGVEYDAELADVEITEFNLPPVWTESNAGLSRSYNMPIEVSGNAMALYSGIPFGTNLGASERIKAVDQDWIEVDYDVDGDSASRTANGHLYWDRAMVDGWNVLASASNGNPYSKTIAIQASDNEGEVISTTANVTMNLAWRQIDLTSGECIYRTGNTIEWDYGFGSKCTGADRYLWAAIPVENVPGAFQLINKETQTCLRKFDGGDGGMDFGACNGEKEVRWYFDREGTGGKTIQRWDASDNAWEYLCGIAFDPVDIRKGACSWDTAKWR